MKIEEMRENLKKRFTMEKLVTDVHKIKPQARLTLMKALYYPTNAADDIIVERYYYGNAQTENYESEND